MADAIDDLRARLAPIAESGFDDLVAHCTRPVEVIAYFLAMLELAQLGHRRDRAARLADRDPAARRGSGIVNRLVGEETLDTAAQVEAILFVAEEPLTVEELAEVLEIPRHRVEEDLELLDRRLDCHGIELRQVGRGWRIYTRPGQLLTWSVSRVLRPPDCRRPRSRSWQWSPTGSR